MYIHTWGLENIGGLLQDCSVSSGLACHWYVKENSTFWHSVNPLNTWETLIKQVEWFLLNLITAICQWADWFNYIYGLVVF